MDARVIIAKLRHQQPLEDGELQWFANGLASGVVSDAQAGSFAMAVCLKGLGRGGSCGTDPGDVRQRHADEMGCGGTGP